MVQASQFNLCSELTLSSFPVFFPNSSSIDSDVLTWLRCQLAEATNLHDRSLVAQLHETLRCVQLFDAQVE